MGSRCANAAKRIKVLLGVKTHGDLRNTVLDSGPHFPYRFDAAFAKLLWLLVQVSEKACALFCFGQVGMIECIPPLINTIRMIYCVSNYYNTTERMTSLFVKVDESIDTFIFILP